MLPELDEIDADAEALEAGAPVRAPSRRVAQQPTASKVQEKKQRAPVNREKRARKRAEAREKHIAKLVAAGNFNEPGAKTNPLPKPDEED